MRPATVVAEGAFGLDDPVDRDVAWSGPSTHRPCNTAGRFGGREKTVAPD